MLADPPHLSRHHRTPSTPSLSSSFRSSKLQTSNPSYHRNQQYSIIGLTNAAGTLVERYSYTAYGTLGIYDSSGTVRTTSTYANRYTYTGREWDADLNLYHFRARWYDPATGGFISRDPLAYVDGMSLYRGYFGVKGKDPEGTIVITGENDPGSFDGCGGYSTVNYTLGLSSDAPCDGYLVQAVTVRCAVQNCGDGKCRYDISSTDQNQGFVDENSSPTFRYFEQWFVEKGKRRPKFWKGSQDTSYLDFPHGECGSIMISTEVRFYCNTVTGDLGGVGPDPDQIDPHRPSPTPGWDHNKTFTRKGITGVQCDATSGDLMATSDKPDWWQTEFLYQGMDDKYRIHYRDHVPVEEGAGRVNIGTFNCCDDCTQDRFGNPSGKWAVSSWAVIPGWVNDVDSSDKDEVDGSGKMVPYKPIEFGR